MMLGSFINVISIIVVHFMLKLMHQLPIDCYDEEHCMV
jgi:hypothetical protein